MKVATGEARGGKGVTDWLAGWLTLGVALPKSKALLC